jgi:protein phosphatase 1L
VALYAIFDGHGGDFAAEFAKDILIQNLCNKIIETKRILHENDDLEVKKCEESKDEDVNETQSAPALKKRSKTTDDDKYENNIDSDILDKLKTQKKSFFFKQNQAQDVTTAPKSLDARCYINKVTKAIDYGKMITDEVLFADHKLIETAKKSLSIAGTTALIAIIEKHRLIVANVGDSRGVLCDQKGRTIPLSFDHKPQSAREHKRIQEAGGFIAFKGVWRVSGILATSRALGDFPLKPKLVIANPDVLEFDLSEHK